MRYDAARQEVPDDRLPMAKHDRFKGRVQVRRIDAGMQPAQTPLRRKAAYAPGGGRITFVGDDQLGWRVRIRGHWGGFRRGECPILTRFYLILSEKVVKSKDRTDRHPCG